MDEVLDLWKSDLELDEGRKNTFLLNQSLKEKDKRNPFYKWLIKNNEPLPIRSILKIIRRRHDGFGIFEHPYLDLEFWDSYSGFYGTSFSQSERACRRLHLFKGKETFGQQAVDLLLGGCTEKEIEALGLEYIGYSVFRPIPTNVIGRTGIAFDTRPSWQFNIDPLLNNEQGYPILKAKQKCFVTLLNARFGIETSEFMQQDPQLGQCASASLWVASNIGSKNFGARHVKFPSITKNAVGPKLPNIPLSYAPIDEDSGLTNTEIKNALSAIGTMYQSESPRFSEENSLATSVRLNQFIYSFVESGLPVILCMHSLSDRIGHAVAVIGHFLPTKINNNNIITLDNITKEKIHSRHTVVSNYINIYYVHDDCYGPFNRLSLHLKKSPLFAFDRNPRLKVSLGRRKEHLTLIEAIVPVHFRVRNAAWDSLPIVITFFEDIYGNKLDPSTIFLWRSFLVSGSEFKQTLRSDKRNFPSEFQSTYGRVHLPKYMWVHEFSETTREGISDCFPMDGKRKIDGEFLVDATTSKNDVRILAWRVAGNMWAPHSGVVVDLSTDELPCFNPSDLNNI